MAVLLDTSAGEIVIDLYTEECPITCKNFLKLCKIKYYNGCLFHNVQQNFIAQTGDPTGTGEGGTSVYEMLYGKQASSFENEIHKHIKHDKVGVVSMVSGNRSQFYFTLRGDDLSHLDGSHTIFGIVAEGHDTLQKINNLYCDENFRPLQDVRIKHSYILDDPFDDPVQLILPPSSPTNEIPKEETVRQRIPYTEKIQENVDPRSAEELEESIRRKEAESRAIVLEMTGDIPDAEVKPPAEVLFIAKLNPVTTDEDLELIFSRFGVIKECSIIRDYKTGDSLNYAFIEFETEDSCLEAYEKMNNVLIDDRRIKVDFSQSVSKLWNKFLLRPRNQKNEKGNNPPANIHGKGNDKVHAHSNQNTGQSSKSHHRDYSGHHTRDNHSHAHKRNEKHDRDPSSRHHSTNDHRRRHESSRRSRSRSRDRSRNRQQYSNKR
jgi:peptidyl-prolyl cis-trans isomerase-like 4